MKIASLFGQGRTVFSCEVFPPKKTSPVDTIYKTLDGLKDLTAFGEALESASLQTLEEGVMTKDLLSLADPSFQARGVNSEEFLDEIAKRLCKKLA